MLNSYKVDKKWKILRKLVNNKLPKAQKAFTNELKFVSFFKYTLLPKRLTVKFSNVLENTKKEYLTGRFRFFLTPHNKFVMVNIMRGFFLIYLIIFYYYKYLDTEKNVKQLYDITVFNYFNNNYFFSYYNNNIKLQKLTKAYVLDTDSIMHFFNIYNFYIFFKLNIFEVLLNFEDYKFEEDQILDVYNTNIKKKKVLKMRTDFYDYVKRKKRNRMFNKFLKKWKELIEAPWNQIEKGEDDETAIKLKRLNKNIKNHLILQNNIFFCFLIYEFALDLNNKFLFSYFNYDFFGKVKLFVEKNKKSKIKNYPYFLTSTYYSYNIDFLNFKKNKSFLYTNYKKYNNFYLNKKFNCKEHLLDVKYFGLKIPFLFFLLYTWYSIYYRRYRYNLYVRGDFFFQEHFSKIRFFIWANNPGFSGLGKNKCKLSTYKYQKLFTLYHLKTYVEFKWFNDWFYFYSSYHIKLVNYLKLDWKSHKNSFLFLFNNMQILNYCNITKINKEHFIDFFMLNLLDISYTYDLFNAYYLFMKTPVTRFENECKLGRLSFFTFDSMIERVFTLPIDKKLLWKYIGNNIIFEHFFSIYLNSNYFNMYFLKDFFNLKKLNKFLKYFKILNFYDKIFHVILLLIDPFFFKYYWRRCFPNRWHKLRGVQDYVLTNVIMYKFKLNVIALNIPKYNFLSYFLNWRIDTGNLCVINNGYSTNIIYNNIIINYLYKQRFIELLKQINFMFKNKKLNLIQIKKKNFKYYIHYYLILLKNYYFDLLVNNIEYNIIFFFLNIKKYIYIINNNKDFFYNKIYSNFVYRYYIYNTLLDTHHYHRWFYNWEQRIFWIYKDYLNHEGPRFYNKKFTDVIK